MLIVVLGLLTLAYRAFSSDTPRSKSFEPPPKPAAMMSAAPSFLPLVTSLRITRST